MTEGEGDLDVRGEGAALADGVLGPIWAALLVLGDGGRFRDDFQLDGEKKRNFFFCGWLDMLGTGCRVHSLHHY
jgi:hypothetical protein